MTTYVTFGSGHSHTINGQVFNKDCVAVFDSVSAEKGRMDAFCYFDKNFSFEYFNELPSMEFFPRGLIRVEDVTIKLDIPLKKRLLLVSKVTQMDINHHVNNAVGVYLSIGMLPAHDQSRIMKLINFIRINCLQVEKAAKDRDDE